MKEQVFENIIKAIDTETKILDRNDYYNLLNELLAELRDRIEAMDNDPY